MVGPFVFRRCSVVLVPLALFLASACSDDTAPNTQGAGGAGGSIAEGAAPPSSGGGGAGMEGGAAGHGGTASQGGEAPGGGGTGTGGAAPLVPPDCPPGTTELAAALDCEPGPLPGAAL